MTSSKIHSTHCERTAFVYVRQSTWLQVSENRESTERQYNLRERAMQLGWPGSRVEVIDEDQGRSGSTATFRTGFQRLAAEVGLGKVGIVLMLEASRLARNNSDWYRLIEICGISGTLIADESAVYNPREPNDRLLLGVKGTLSEAELFTLRTRLYEGRWNKARKGLLRFSLPVGYVVATDGAWVLDPDTQVRERLSYVFNSFRRLGVVRAVVRDLRQQGLGLPTRVTAKEAYGSLIWKEPTLSTVFRILHNPAYAGAYVYGRSEYLSERRSPKTGKASAHVRNVAQWPVRITEHHPAYIGWEEFVKNQEQLRQNWGRNDSRGVPREGRALLQGIVYCGICGRKMSVQNRSVKESRSPSYVCMQGYQNGEEKTCQCMTSRPIDAVVAEAFLVAISPVNLQVATQVMDQIEQELVSRRRQRELQLEQARYEARLAQRQYDGVDPSNRLVAAELERRWNEKLERVTELERAFAQTERDAEWKLAPEERAAITELSRDLPAIWNAETTTNQERKQLLRMAIESVQVDGVTQAGQIEVQIRWRTGTITILNVKRTAPGERSLKTPEEAVSRIHKMAPRRTYAEIATALNRAGLRSAFGRRFTNQHVGYICRRDGLAGRKPRSLPATPGDSGPVES
ncbi:MAG TPA: recombinase family protein [Candidatus Binatia bacterium]|nr:recombinase family protein [Candidatus Binatia bacterium]